MALIQRIDRLELEPIEREGKQLIQRRHRSGIGTRCVTRIGRCAARRVSCGAATAVA
jgi:hypothetical protein